MTRHDPFDPRVRFNWGFWDGRHDRQSQRPRLNDLTSENIVERHPCRPYAEGYMRGFATADLWADSSEPAWLQYQAEQERP